MALDRSANKDQSEGFYDGFLEGYLQCKADGIEAARNEITPADHMLQTSRTQAIILRLMALGEK